MNLLLARHGHAKLALAVVDEVAAEIDGHGVQIRSYGPAADSNSDGIRWYLPTR